MTDSTEVTYDHGAIRQFLADRCEPCPAGVIQAAVLYEAYVAWCASELQLSRRYTATMTSFGVHVVKAGISKRRVAAGILYQGIKLKD